MKDQAVTEAVALYREASYRRWLTITTAAALSMGALMLLSQSIQLMRFLLTRNESQQLYEEIAELNGQYMERLKEIKLLKGAKRTLLLLTSRPPLDEMLMSISQAIPDHTILSTIRYQPDGITLEGYAPDAPELETFMAALKAEGLSNITLQLSQTEAAGLRFIISLALSFQSGLN